MTTKDFQIAVNKFFYYSQNYEVSLVTYNGINGERQEYLPSFFNDIKWGCSTAHIAEKWLALKGDSYGIINRFYAELDGNNRAKLLEWIFSNYKLSEDYGISL